MTSSTPPSIAEWRPPRQNRRPPPPAHLKPPAAKVWRAVVAEYDLEAWDLALLKGLCTLLQRADDAREAVASAPTEYPEGRYGPKPHPGIAVEAQALVAAGRLLRELRLSEAPVELRRRLGGGS